jgi:hypothetical protein
MEHMGKDLSTFVERIHGKPIVTGGTAMGDVNLKGVFSTVPVQVNGVGTRAHDYARSPQITKGCSAPSEQYAQWAFLFERVGRIATPRLCSVPRGCRKVPIFEYRC